MKAKWFGMACLLLVSIIALSFAHSFVSSASAGAPSNCSVTNDGSNDTVSCDNDQSDSGFITNDGNDTVTIKNDSEEGDIDTGNDNDKITVSNDSSVTGIDAWNGDDTIVIDHSSVVDSANEYQTVDGGDGNDSITIIDDQSRGAGPVLGGTGNDTITLEGSYVANSVDGGDNDDTIILSNGGETGSIAGGAGNDTVEIGNGASVAGNINGGADVDTLKFTFKVSSKAQKDKFDALLHSNGTSPDYGYIEFGGTLYQWSNFEQLLNLLTIAKSSGAHSASIGVIGDTRLNNQDMAAPVAVFCNAGTIEAWVIGADGHGNLSLSTTAAALPQSVNGVSIALSGDQIVTTYGGYSFSFPALVCAG